jgi:hypothetical protein
MLTTLPVSGPPADAKEPIRRVVFLSHATPEDNDFVVWLGTRLTAAGYEVWSDVTRLLGGEFFWKDIDDAIRRCAAKVVVCLSRAAVQKEGVLNEIAISVATGRKLSTAEFTIPLRVDDLPYDELPPQLINRNVIDFSGNWASGLSRLLKVLERDEVPRREAGDAQQALGAWQIGHQQRARALVEAEERVESNWLPLLALPSTVRLFEIGMPVSLGDVPRLASAVTWPHFVYARLIGGFGGVDAFQDDVGPNLPLKVGYSIETEAFLGGYPKDGPPIDYRDARNYVSNMLRQAWDKAMSARGLAAYELSDGSKAWWVSSGFLPDDKVHFIKPDGRKGWRQLVGRDNPRNVFWHVGFAAKPALSPPLHLVLRPHVILTTDGKTPLDDRKRMNSLRRSVCKSWFNARWRDLVAGFAQWVGGGEDTFLLPIGLGEGATIATRPFLFSAPMSLAPEIIAAVGGDSNTDEDDANLLAERLEDPAFRDFDDAEDERDQEPDGGAQE